MQSETNSNFQDGPINGDLVQRGRCVTYTTYSNLLRRNKIFIDVPYDLKIQLLYSSLPNSIHPVRALLDRTHLMNPRETLSRRTKLRSTHSSTLTTSLSRPFSLRTDSRPIFFRPAQSPRDRHAPSWHQSPVPSSRKCVPLLLRPPAPSDLLSTCGHLGDRHSSSD